MWMSQPTPVTTRSMTTVRWSICRSKPARKSPATIQVKYCWTQGIFSGARCVNSRTASSAARKERPVEPTATALTILFGHLLPNRPLMAEPRSGSAGRSRDSSGWTLEFEEVDALDIEGLAIARDQNDDAEADGRFRGGHDDDEEDEDLAVELVERLAESHEGEIDGVEHQLDGHEDGDDIALEDEGNDAESEENGAEDQVVVRGDHFSFHLAGRRAR